MKNILTQINKKHFINGELDCFSPELIDVINPSTLEKVGEVPELHRDEIVKAIDCAYSAFNDWSNLLPKERAEYLHKWQNLIIKNIDELAEILTLEQGKTISEAKREIIYGANFIGWFAAEATTISGYVSAGVKENQKIMVEYEPVGVVGAITPWNFPSAMISRKLAPALAAGCTVVLKPSEHTPFSALALGYLSIEAGIPKGIINIINSKPELVSEVFASDKRVRKISFTGSTRVGKILYKNSSDTIKRLSLELGGNSPYIICEDANIEKVVIDLIGAKIRSTGQSCTSPNRIFIHAKIYDSVVHKLKENFASLVVGDGFNPKVAVGPLINSLSVAKIARLIEDATSKSAEIILGGKKSTHYYDTLNNLKQASDNHTFFEPTILINCSDKMDIFKEEIFGPVLACYKFDNYDDVVNSANNSDYGLASYVYTENSNRAWQISDKLDYGIVGINESIISNEVGAFGGRKESGFGIEGSKLGIYEYLNTKYKCINY